MDNNNRIKTEATFDGLPEACYSTLPSSGELIILRRGEKGYYRTDIPCHDKSDAEELVREYNDKLGVTLAQKEAMVAGSMFGWSVAGANPANYDQNGAFVAFDRGINENTTSVNIG